MFIEFRKESKANEPPEAKCVYNCLAADRNVVTHVQKEGGVESIGTILQLSSHDVTCT